ncbi:MAG: hypothetical protein ACRDF7_00460 [Candidatus Limnocylindrales bacterium]
MPARPGAEARRGLALLAAGVLIVVAAQHLAPLGAPPLYDGVVVAEPYRWLVPAAGQQGGPQSATGSAELQAGGSPLVALGTPEQPPQAQIFAISGTLILPPGTTSIAMSIVPILPAALPGDGHIAGNVYRISVTNQAGAPLTALPTDLVSVVLRGPDGTAGAWIEQSNAGAWQTLKTDDAGFSSTWLAVVTGFGDFALVVPGSAEPYPTATPGGAPGSPTPATSPGQGTPTPAATITPPIATPAPDGGTSGGGVLPYIAVVAVVGVGVGLVIGALMRRSGSRRPPRDQRRSKRR